MEQITKLIDRINSRVNMNLREFGFDVSPYTNNLIPNEQMIKFNAFYAITGHHPTHFNFIHSNLAGSYFLGKCITDHSLLYKTDVRGDELKKKGDIFNFSGIKIPVDNDEVIRIRDSYLIKTLVHSYSHDPESPEEFLIRNTVSGFYSNIHGSPVEGCYIAPFSTVDLTTMHSCILGAFSYVQAGDLYHQKIPSGTIWIKGDNFEFKYNYDAEVLKKYIHNAPGQRPSGLFMDFVESRKDDFQKNFDSAINNPEMAVSGKSALNRYAYVGGETKISENVLISQRAYLENAWMGPGTNAQENAYIINSRLKKNNVTAHGAKIINTMLDEKVFVGFNSFLNASQGNPLEIGKGCMIMPHTIIDPDESLTIPEEYIVWGYIRNKADLEQNSIAVSDLKTIQGEARKGNMVFKGNGDALVSNFEQRINTILQANGAFFDGVENSGHAQESHRISYNIIQPHLTGEKKGLYPTIDIRP